MKLYVGNLAHRTTEAELQQVFEEFGEVATITIVQDRMTGEPRGFGFVEMPNQAEALSAIAGLAGHILHDRPLNVNEARPPREQGRGRDRGPNGRGGGRRSW